MVQDFGFSFGISLGFKGLSEILKATNNVDKLSKTLRLNDTYTNKLAKSLDNLKLKSEKLNAAKNNLSSLKENSIHSTTCKLSFKRRVCIICFAVIF